MKPLKIAFHGIKATIGTNKLKAQLRKWVDGLNWGHVEAEIAHHVGSLQASIIVRWLKTYLCNEIEAM
jgi:hypothetical protein